MRLVCSFFAALLAASADDKVQLFNGKDLTGWEMVGPGRFVIENGLLKTEGGMGLLYYKERPIGGSTLHVVFKTSGPKDNAGVFIRLPERPMDPWYGVHNGYEVQIDGAGDDWHSTGAIYSLSKANKRLQKAPGEWNTMDIQLDGQKTTILVNGETVNEFSGDQTVPERKAWYEPTRGPRPDVGFVGLQNHDGASTVFFKEVSVSPIAGKSSLSQGDRDFLMSYLHSTRKQLLDFTAGLSDAQWKYKPAPDKWSIAEIAEHLTLSEQTIFQGMLGGLKKSEPKPAELIDDKKFIAMITSREQKAKAPEVLVPSNQWPSREAMISAFTERRDRNIQYVENTSAGLRESYVKFATGALSVYQGLLLVPAHCERHLAQMKEVHQSPGYPKQ